MAARVKNYTARINNTWGEESFTADMRGPYSISKETYEAGIWALLDQMKSFLETEAPADAPYSVYMERHEYEDIGLTHP